MEPTGIYRPGYPFTSVELQAMAQGGALRHVIGDVYAEANLPQTAALRATAAYSLLNSTLRRRGILCGQTAAWVYLGTGRVERITVIARGSALRQAAFDRRWQLHQVAVGSEQVQRQGPARVTTALRTAADLFSGFGVLGCRKPLDRISRERARLSRTEYRLQHWPAVTMPLQGRDEDLVAMGPEDRRRIQQRWESIAALCREFQLETEQLADAVLRILCRTGQDLRRRDRVVELLDYCTSRRLPTVR